MMLEGSKIDFNTLELHRYYIREIIDFRPLLGVSRGISIIKPRLLGLTIDIKELDD